MRKDKVILRTVAAALSILASASLTVAQAPPAKEIPTGDVRVKVVLPGGASFKTCTVNLADKTVTLEKGETEALVSGVPVRRLAAGAQAVVGQGWFKPDLRFVGVEEVFVKPNAVVEATLTLEQVEPIAGKSVEEFCRRCHPSRGEPIERGQILRDVHASGRVLKDSNVAQIRKYNDNLVKLEKEGKPHGLPMRTEEREVIENGRKVKRTLMTCESCHTIHLATAYESYVVASFRERSDLCRGCHD